MLVALMIMGLFVGLVTLVALPDERAVLRLEADRLARLLDLAADEARLTGRSIAWTAEADGYRFWRASEEEAAWAEVRDDELLRARSLPQGVAITGLRVENLPPQGAARLEFRPQGSPLAFSIGLALGAERYAVAGSPVGEIRALPGEGAATGDAARQ
jgi:general secretion pathway protein H